MTNESISFLLGAGFSAPQGYPVGNTLNENLLYCSGESFSFHSSGVLCTSVDGAKPDFGYKTSYDYQFDFCIDLIQHFYKVKGYFDYEEFYDFFTISAENDQTVITLLSDGEYGGQTDLHQMLFALKNIYSQLVSHYLIDKNGHSWYDDAAHMCSPIWPGYTGILNVFQKLKETYLIDVHTLNHDLFFERFNYSDWIQGEICDGFTEEGSPYYGELTVESRKYNCRLQYYNGSYRKGIRLYKLHGSKDYGIYHSSTGSIARPEMYVKTRWGIGFGNLKKEVKDQNGDIKYEDCWINYHADFLTGTTSKIERYSEPLLYKILFEKLRSNLKKASKLIIIGYGGRDSEVNEIILKHFDFKSKPSFIIDPYPGSEIIELGNSLNATIIKKQLEDVGILDLE